MSTRTLSKVRSLLSSLSLSLFSLTFPALHFVWYREVLRILVFNKYLTPQISLQKYFFLNGVPFFFFGPFYFFLLFVSIKIDQVHF